MDESIEKIVKQSLLYDFYGELLTPHQRQIYEAAVFEDLSLSEIAEDNRISRQGVHDLLKRCNKALEDYESKLHLVEKFQQTRKQIEEIYRLASEYEKQEDASFIRRIEGISKEILKEL